MVIPYMADELEITSLVVRLAFDGVAISIIAHMEVYQGTLRAPNPERSQVQLERLLSVIPILPLSPAIARRCARLREYPKAHDRRVRSRALDLLIVATALEHGLWLVTRNLADFSDIPELALYDFT